MTAIEVIRKYTGDSGTFGQFQLNGSTFYTAELPWRNNLPAISHVKVGLREVTLKPSASFGLDLYHLADQYGRTNCMIHWGNWAGDVNKINPETRKPYRSDVEGCMLLGYDLGLLGVNGTQLERQDAVLKSKQAVLDFMKMMNGEPFMLNIIEQYEE